jgi:hypothetical protein
VRSQQTLKTIGKFLTTKCKRGGLKMNKRGSNFIAIVFLSMVVCFAAPQLSQASTIVSVEPGGTFVNIANFNFEILTPSGTQGSTFTPTLPANWLFLPTGNVVSAFDGGGSNSLPSGAIGSFAIDVTLGNWVFGNQGGNTISPSAYVVNHVGTNYVVSASAVPIPAAVWLLGSGVVGLVALKRRKAA